MLRRSACRRAFAALLLVSFVAPAGAQVSPAVPPTAPAPGAPRPHGVFPLARDFSVTLDALPAAPAAYDGTRAYVPLRTGALEAVSLLTGQKAWTADVATTRQPATGDDLVFVATDVAVQALHAATGSVKWTLPTGGAAPTAVYWQAGSIVTGNEKGDVWFIDAVSGRTSWQQPLGATISGRPVISGTRLFVPLADGRLVALDLASGAAAWQRHLKGAPGDVLVADDRLYAGSADNSFYCVSLADGRVRWRWPTGGDIVGQPAVDRERVYFLSLDNLLRALDRRSGVQRWKTPLASRPSYGPVPVGHLFLTTGIAPTLYVFQVSDGTAAGQHALAVDADLVGPPFVRTGLTGLDVTFYVVAGNGELIGLRPAVTTLPPAPPAAK